jgi:hypothetical protein
LICGSSGDFLLHDDEKLGYNLVLVGKGNFVTMKNFAPVEGKL